MKSLAAILICLFGSVAFGQENCLEKAREIAPQLSVEARRDFEMKFTEARETFTKKPGEVENVIGLRRRTAYLGHYKNAIAIYTEGIRRFPSDARKFRHLVHRFLPLRCFDDAIADFKTAAFWVKGPPD